MLLQRQDGDPLERIQPVIGAQELAQLQRTVAETFVSEEIAQYVVDLVDATRRSELLLRGGSPRATLAVTGMAKAVAQLRGRDYVVPKDVQEAFVVAVAHRLQVSAEAEGQNMDAPQVLRTLLGKVAAPKLR